MKDLRKRIKDYSIAYLFILPAILFVGFLVLYPIFSSLINSFFSWDGVTTKAFIGIKNYIEIFKDQTFFLAFKNTALFAFSTVGALTIIGFTLSVIIDYKVKGWKLYRFVYFLPAMMSSVAVAFLWTRIYDPRMGLINKFLELLHLDSLKQLWLGNPKIVMYSISAAYVWQWSGLAMIFFLAAMQNIDENVYEAAKIDGINIFGRVFKITLPMIKDQFILIVMILIIDSFRIFDMVWVLTRGGPGNNSQVLGTYLYEQSFNYHRFGYSSVISVISLVLAFLLAIVYINYGKFHRIKAR